MKQKRGHYFLSCFEKAKKLKIEDLKTNSEIPLSLKANVLKFKIPKNSHSKSECCNLKKNLFQIDNKEKSQSFSKSYSLCDLYQNPDYKDSQFSLMYPISRETSLCNAKNLQL